MPDYRYISSVTALVTEHLANKKLNPSLKNTQESRIDYLEITPVNGEFEEIQTALKSLGIRSIRNRKSISVKFTEGNLELDINRLSEGIKNGTLVEVKDAVPVAKKTSEENNVPLTEEANQLSTEGEKIEVPPEVPVHKLKLNERPREEKSRRIKSFQELEARFHRVYLKKERTDEITDNIEARVSTVSSFIQESLLLKMMEMGLDKEKIIQLLLVHEIKSSGLIARIVDIIFQVLAKKGIAFTDKEDFMDITPGEEIKLKFKTLSVEELLEITDDVCKEIKWEKIPPSL